MTAWPAAAPTVDPRPLHLRLTELELDRFTDFEAANERLYRAGLTDGLPVMPPTSSRIDAMLQGCVPASHPMLGPLPPGFITPTPWDVAACAVLAGCEAGAIPLLLAVLSAIVEPSFNLLGIQTTTGAAAPLIVVNGPVIRELGINAGRNALGPGWRPNATIGRALRFLLQNVGLAVPGTGDMATHGHPGKYTWLIAENEPASPWPALHTTRGFEADASAVTLVGGVGNVEVVLPLSSPEALIGTMAIAMLGGHYGSSAPGSRQQLVLLPPECAQFLARHNWDRARFQEELYREMSLQLGWLGNATAERSTITPAERSPAGAHHVRAAPAAETILVVVTGGVGVKATFVPTWGGGTSAVTRSVMRTA